MSTLLSTPNVQDEKMFGKCVFSSVAIVFKSHEISRESGLRTHNGFWFIFGNQLSMAIKQSAERRLLNSNQLFLCVFAPNHKCLIIICQEIIRFLGRATINVKSAVCTPPPLLSHLTRIIFKQRERRRPANQTLKSWESWKNVEYSPSPENEIKIVPSHFFDELSCRSDKRYWSITSEAKYQMFKENTFMHRYFWDHIIFS